MARTNASGTPAAPSHKQASAGQYARGWQWLALVNNERVKTAQAELLKEHAVLLVADSDNQIVGSCIAWLVLDEVQVLDLFVSSAHRREGWGRQLLQGLLTR